MKGTWCDACMIGYKPGRLEECVTCKGEFCSTCIGTHGCKEDDLQ